MDLNLVRLQIPLNSSAERVMNTVFATDRARIERLLAPLCSRALSSDPELVRRHQKPGLPFVFSVPQHDVMDCLLLGPAIPELSRILTAVAEIAELPEIRCFSACDYQGNAMRLGADGGDALPVLSLAELLDMATPRYAGCRELQVTLQTPLRLTAAGRELTRFEPVRFARGVVRRLTSLAAYYGNAGIPERFAWLAEGAAAIRVTDARPLSAPVGQRGVLGRFILAGVANELGPLLELGGWLHLGKHASFGAGAFRVTPLS